MRRVTTRPWMLQVLRAKTGYDMSLCLHLSEAAGSPHPILHSLDLYAPSVTTY